MKVKALPQPVLSRMLDLADRVDSLQADALVAERQIDDMRRMLSSNSAVSQEDQGEQFTKIRDGFPAAHAEMKRKQMKAQAHAALLSKVKQWIDDLPSDAKLHVVNAPTSESLTKVRDELKKLRNDLDILYRSPPASPDIAQRVKDYVNTLARACRPMVRGASPGQTLDVTWPMGPNADRSNGNGFSRSDCNALLLLAATDPKSLSKLVFDEITSMQPMSQSEYGAVIKELKQKIESASYAEAAIIEKTGGEHDVDIEPACLLGVKVADPGPPSLIIVPDTAADEDAA